MIKYRRTNEHDIQRILEIYWKEYREDQFNLTFTTDFLYDVKHGKVIPIQPGRGKEIANIVSNRIISGYQNYEPALYRAN